MQGGGGRVHGERVPDPEPCRECLLQRVRTRSGGDPPGAQHLHDGSNLSLANGRPVEGDGFGQLSVHEHLVGIFGCGI